MGEPYYDFPGHGFSADVQGKVSHLRERANALNCAAEAIKSPLIAELGKLYTSFAGCMDLLARQLPFKAGDRVRLVRAPNCNNDWRYSKHFLVVGAVGTIKVIDIDYLMRDWSVCVEFDDESWICSHGEDAGKVFLVKPDQRHVYGLSPDFVEKLP
jgi:hypothetical protein